MREVLKHWFDFNMSLTKEQYQSLSVIASLSEKAEKKVTPKPSPEPVVKVEEKVKLFPKLTDEILFYLNKHEEGLILDDLDKKLSYRAKRASISQGLWLLSKDAKIESSNTYPKVYYKKGNKVIEELKPSKTSVLG